MSQGSGYGGQNQHTRKHLVLQARTACGRSAAPLRFIQLSFRRLICSNTIRIQPQPCFLLHVSVCVGRGRHAQYKHTCVLSGKGALHTASAFTSFLKHFSLRVSTKAAQNSGSAPHHRALCWNPPPGDPQSQHSLVKIQSTETCQHNSQGRKSRVEQAAGKVKK